MPAPHKHFYNASGAKGSSSVCSAKSGAKLAAEPTDMIACFDALVRLGLPLR